MCIYMPDGGPTFDDLFNEFKQPPAEQEKLKLARMSANVPFPAPHPVEIEEEIRKNFPPELTAQIRQYSEQLMPAVTETMVAVNNMGAEEEGADVKRPNILNEDYAEVVSLLQRESGDPLVEVSALKSLIYDVLLKLARSHEDNLAKSLRSHFTRESFEELGTKLTALPDSLTSLSAEHGFPEIADKVWGKRSEN